MNLILNRIEAEGLACDPDLLSADVEKAINSGSWSERHHARLRSTHSDLFPEPSSNNAEAWVLLGEIWSQLHGVDRDLILGFTEGKSYEQLETEIGIPKGALRTRVARIRARLRHYSN